MGDLRAIPRTDRLLADPRFAAASKRLGPALVKRAVNAAQDRARSGEISPHAVADVALDSMPLHSTSLRRVLNATGIVVHTNLGRAPLSQAAVDALAIASGTTDIEYDLVTGQRGRRGSGPLDALAAAVPEAEAVHVVNNNAAALVLVATALGQGREVVLSRGELIEIGDGFRIPDLLESTGARLREVGTTNRTTLDDYTAAMGPMTGCLLKIHPSNFTITGFTAAVAVEELAAPCAEQSIPLVVDIGSGLLSPHPALPEEPDAASVLRAGADLVTASGDKLLGGPQAGLLLGRRDLVDLARRHPIARALRVDKLTLAALEATLTGPAPPVAASLEADVGGLRARAHRIAAALEEAGIAADIVDTFAAVGGGGAPNVQIPSVAVVLPAKSADLLRTGDIPVVGRLVRGRCFLDLRTVDPMDDELLTCAVQQSSRT